MVYRQSSMVHLPPIMDFRFAFAYPRIVYLHYQVAFPLTRRPYQAETRLMDNPFAIEGHTASRDWE